MAMPQRWLLAGSFSGVVVVHRFPGVLGQLLAGRLLVLLDLIGPAGGQAVAVDGHDSQDGDQQADHSEDGGEQTHEPHLAGQAVDEGALLLRELVLRGSGHGKSPSEVWIRYKIVNDVWSGPEKGRDPRPFQSGCVSFASSAPLSSYPFLPLCLASGPRRILTVCPKGSAARLRRGKECHARIG